MFKMLNTFNIVILITDTISLSVVPLVPPLSMAGD